MSTAPSHEGGCLCGAARYRIAGEPFDLCYCHCSICRKLTGSFGGAYGSVAREDFTWLEGENGLLVYSPTKVSRRYSCATCGAYLLTEHDAEHQNVFVSLGSLETHIEGRPTYRQFVGDAPSWWRDLHDIPSHAGWPPGD